VLKLKQSETWPFFSCQNRSTDFNNGISHHTNRCVSFILDVLRRAGMGHSTNKTASFSSNSEKCYFGPIRIPPAVSNTRHASRPITQTWNPSEPSMAPTMETEADRSLRAPEKKRFSFSTKRGTIRASKAKKRRRQKLPRKTFSFSPSLQLRTASPPRRTAAPRPARKR
jgi:hypothetical protein